MDEKNRKILAVGAVTMDKIVVPVLRLIMVILMVSLMVIFVKQWSGAVGDLRALELAEGSAEQLLFDANIGLAGMFLVTALYFIMLRKK